MRIVTRVCAASGCPELVEGGSYCEEHQPEPWKNKNTAQDRVRGRRWQTLRRSVLRDQPFCAVENCAYLSVEVDHVMPIAWGGDPVDRRNLQGLCKPHHDEKSEYERVQQRPWPGPAPKQRVVLVCGPPCSGKTTYVREHASEEDRIVDFDDIREALAGDRYEASRAVDIRAAEMWSEQLEQRHDGVTWVVWAAPTKKQRASIRQRFDAEVRVLSTDRETCLERAREERPPQYLAAIEQWFETWQPASNEQTV